MSKTSEDTERSNEQLMSGESTSGTFQSATLRPNSNSSTSNAGPSRIIGSQAKRQEDVTRQGTQKMKFVPTLPARRKKPDLQEETLPTAAQPTERGRGRGRGLGHGRGRGAPPPPRPDMQMTASGPFAMGPALAGLSKRRTPRSNFAPVMPMGPGSASLGEGLSRTGAPVLSRGKEKKRGDSVKEEDGDVEVYSDPDEGVQIVDMEAIKTMDWMAPESLRRERNTGKILKKRKAEVVKTNIKKEGQTQEAEAVDPVVEKDLANALDLSESEEEEEMEDLIEDFAMDMEDEDSLTRQEKLYFFQFPQPFPTFSAPKAGEVADVDAMMVDDAKPIVDDGTSRILDKEKKVSFAEDVKPLTPKGSNDTHGKTTNVVQDGGPPTAEERLDGVIGQLEVHQSGMIKMRLNNGMLMDVTAATQPSFLQHAVLLDPVTKKVHVLGEVNRRFVVSPDVDKLLEEMQKAEATEHIKVDSAMDAS